MATPFPFGSGNVLTAAQMNAITTLPINDQTASYSAVVGDVGKRIVMDVATANTVTIDDDIFSVGDTIFIANKGAGTTTITAGSGVTINTSGSLALAQYGGGTLLFTSASDATFFGGGGGKVLQVVQATHSTAVTSTSTSYVTTGLNATITPSSTSSKILVMVTVPARAANSNGAGYFTIFRGTVAGTNLFGSFGFSGIYANGLVRGTVASNYLDSPATISAQTYTVGMKAEQVTSGVTAQEDSMTSTMTLLEISA